MNWKWLRGAEAFSIDRNRPYPLNPKVSPSSVHDELLLIHDNSVSPDLHDDDD